MEVGHLERIEKEGKPIVFGGQVEVGEVIGDVYLIPIAGPKRDPKNSPDYQVKLRKPNEDGYRSRGAAWVKEFKDGSGQFFSITFDAPEFLRPVYVAAFPDDEQPKDAKADVFFTMRWGRAKPRDGGAANPDPVADDAIPY